MSILTLAVPTAETLSGNPPEDRFLAEVVDGLSAPKKFIPSRYFYDAEGSRIFEEIMALPGYYLTRRETEILERRKEEIAARVLSGAGSLRLIDLGCGNGAKSKILLEHLAGRGLPVLFNPVDICRSPLDAMEGSWIPPAPDISLQPVQGTYAEALEWMRMLEAPERRLALFLGSNLGNMRDTETALFLHGLRRGLRRGDFALLGFDLRKDPRLLQAAYDDAQGVTARFNLNLLGRINRELDADFRLDRFRHHAVYEPVEGLMRSFLLSTEAQVVRIGAAGLQVRFEAWEALHTENSCKYSLSQIEALAESAGFRVARHFEDERGHFTDSLWLAV